MSIDHPPKKFFKVEDIPVNEPESEPIDFEINKDTGNSTKGPVLSSLWTRGLRQQLADLGYSAEIRKKLKLTTEDAQNILKSGRCYQSDVVNQKKEEKTVGGKEKGKKTGVTEELIREGKKELNERKTREKVEDQKNEISGEVEEKAKEAKRKSEIGLERSLYIRKNKAGKGEDGAYRFDGNQMEEARREMDESIAGDVSINEPEGKPADFEINHGVKEEASAENPDGEIITKSVGTRKEMYGELRGLLNKFTEGAKERLGMSERGKQLELNLEDRDKGLLTKAKELGIEGLFREAGKSYNKLNWKTKLAVGLGLGIGAGALATVSIPAAWAFMGVIAVQRVAGLSSMFLKYESKLQGDKWGKEKAMGKAIAYTALMTGGMLLLVEGVKEGIDFAHQNQGHVIESAKDTTHEWLKQHWPFGATDAVAPTQEVIPSPIQTPEMPEIYADAAPGHGYEYMVKRLWEQLQDKNLDPSKYAEGSDIRQLIEAKPDTINEIVHNIAKDPQHGFFNTDGTSVLIKPTDHISFNPDGQIHLGDENYSNGFPVHAPDGSSVTPEYHPEASAAEAPPPVEVAKITPAPVESDPVVGPSVDNAPPAAPYAETPAVRVEAPAAPETAQTFTSIDHALINKEIPAIYQTHLPTGESYLVAYGGTDEARFEFIQKFLSNPTNQGKSIRWAHSVSSIFGPRVQVDELGAQTIAGHTSWIANFFAKPVELPDPKNFEKLIIK